MEVLYLVLAIAWSVLCLVLFFKIWGMTNDVREIKDFLIGNENQSQYDAGGSSDNNYSKEPEKLSDEVKESLAEQQKAINVTWNHKYNVGDLVIYKYSKKVLSIGLILEKEKEYKCIDVDNNVLLSAIFSEDELIPKK